MAKTTTAVQGLKALMALNYSQASLARMFDVDPATTNQWIRLGQVGERMLGRVKFIPELKSKITPEDIRPDLPPHRIAASVEAAKAWWAEAREEQRAPEAQIGVARKAPAKVAKVQPKAKKKAATPPKAEKKAAKVAKAPKAAVKAKPQQARSTPKATKAAAAAGEAAKGATSTPADANTITFD